MSYKFQSVIKDNQGRGKGVIPLKEGNKEGNVAK